MSANNGGVLLTPATPTAGDAGVCEIRTLTMPERFPAIAKKRDKCAIIGFAGTSRHLAPYDNPDWECWLLNESHRQNWCKRISRHFQMHQRWDFTKQNNKSYQEHWLWLQKKHPFPVYMMEQHDDVPSSVKYPLDEICERFLPNVRRGTIDGDTILNQFFTSSFSYQCALALYLDFKEIAIFGYEMQTLTEYFYQAESTCFWLGLAAGLGTKIYIPDNCRLLNAQLYGYEVDRMINRQRLEFLQRRHQSFFDLANVELQRIAGRREEAIMLVNKSKTAAEKKTYSIRSQELMQAEINALAKARELMGWIRCYESLIKTVDNMHAGKDPGDGFLGPEGDLDPAAEQAVQDAAEAKARADAEKELEVSE